MDSFASSNATPTYDASPVGSTENSASQNAQNEESSQNEEELALGCKRTLASPARNPFKRRNTKMVESSSQPYDFDEEVVRKGSASMIISLGYPLSMTKHVGFQRFVGSLQPLSKTISPDTIKTDIMEIYKQERSKTMELLENNESRFAITTNMWKTSNGSKSFMAVIAHFVDESWISQSRLIGFLYLPSAHTDEDLCDALLNCLTDWNLHNKLGALTLDNSSTNDGLMDLVKSKLSSASLLLGGELLYMRCCAYILNSIVKDCLEAIGVALEKIRDSVDFWVATRERYKKFKETVRQLKISSTEKLVLDYETNWMSTFSMLNVAIQYKDVFKRLKQEEPIYECEPSEEEWEKATQICDMLEVFNNIAELLSLTKYSTADFYFLVIIRIKTALNQWIVCGKPFIENMAGKIVEKFDKWFIQIPGIVGVATVLDPRYKLKLFEYYFPLLYGDDVAKLEIEKIRKLCYDLFAEYESKLKLDSEDECGDDPSYLFPSEELDFMTKFDKFVAFERENTKAKSELDYYFEERVIPRKFPDFELFSWWKNALKFSHVTIDR